MKASARFCMSRSKACTLNYTALTAIANASPVTTSATIFLRTVANSNHRQSAKPLTSSIDYYHGTFWSVTKLMSEGTPASIPLDGSTHAGNFATLSADKKKCTSALSPY